jgi:hypothetical protein
MHTDLVVKNIGRSILKSRGGEAMLILEMYLG